MNALESYRFAHAYITLATCHEFVFQVVATAAKLGLSLTHIYIYAH